jgi:hypothetical protein
VLGRWKRTGITCLHWRPVLAGWECNGSKFGALPDSVGPSLATASLYIYTHI